MKRIKNFSLCLMMIFLSAPAGAEMETAVTFGLRSNWAETDVPRATVDSKSGFLAGFLAWLPIQNRFGIRSGAVYNQRFVSLGPTNQGDVDIQYSYWDIPLTPTFQVSPAVSLYGGPVLAFIQSKEVHCTLASQCAAVDVTSFILPWQLGVDLKLMPQLGVELFIEGIAGDLSRNVSNMKSLGLSLLVLF